MSFTARAGATTALVGASGAGKTSFLNAGILPALERVAANAAMSECAPRTDVRASDDYRRRLVGVLVSKALQQCRQRLQVAAGTT